PADSIEGSCSAVKGICHNLQETGAEGLPHGIRCTSDQQIMHFMHIIACTLSAQMAPGSPADGWPAPADRLTFTGPNSKPWRDMTASPPEPTLSRRRPTPPRVGP